MFKFLLKFQKMQLFGFCIVLIMLFLFYDKNLHIIVNSFHNNFSDIFFKYITYLGDGVLFPVFVLIFGFVKKKQSLRFAMAGILTLLVTFVLKKIVFPGFPRPVEYFGAENLHLIEGVKMCHWNSFPSGHSMAAFAMFTLLFFYFKNVYLKWGAMVLAFLAAFSRVYLSQHFLLDILVGAMIGIGLAHLSKYWTRALLKVLKKNKKNSKKGSLTPTLPTEYGKQL
jgi:membrane-associated phospholipid phosphatase